MRSWIFFLLALSLGAPAWGGPGGGPPGLVRAIRQKGRAVSRFESKLDLTREDLRLLRSFYPSGFAQAAPPLHLQALQRWRARDGFQLFLNQGGARYYRFLSRQGASLRYAGLFRLGRRASASHGPALTDQPALDLGFEDVTPSAAVPHAHHPMLLLWPFELKPPLADERFAPALATENLFGRPTWRIRMTGSGIREQVLWIDRETSQVLRIAATLASSGALLQADYRYGEAEFPAWQQVEVSVGHKPLFLARAEEVVVNERRTRLPRATALTRPGGRFERIRILGFSWADLTRAQQGAVLGLALVGIFLGGRWLLFLLRRQRFSREVILLEPAGGPWNPWLRRLDVPVARFTPQVLSRELTLLGRSWTHDGGPRPRALLVAPNSCGVANEYGYLLRSFVKQGGRVLLLHHDPAHFASLPFEAEMIPIPLGQVGRLSVDPEGPWRRTRSEEVGQFAVEAGTGWYYARIDGQPVGRPLLQVNATEGGDGAPRVGAAMAIFPQGRGEWLLCQLDLRASLQDPQRVGQRLTRDLLDLLQGRRLVSPELEA